jgi:hypothetical protein
VIVILPQLTPPSASRVVSRVLRVESRRKVAGQRDAWISSDPQVHYAATATLAMAGGAGVSPTTARRCAAPRTNGKFGEQVNQLASSNRRRRHGHDAGFIINPNCIVAEHVHDCPRSQSLAKATDSRLQGVIKDQNWRGSRGCSREPYRDVDYFGEPKNVDPFYRLDVI